MKASIIMWCRNPEQKKENSNFYSQIENELRDLIQYQ